MMAAERQWGVLMTRRLPDGRRIELVHDNATNELVTFATEAEAQAVADRLASVPGAEFKAVPLNED